MGISVTVFCFSVAPFFVLPIFIIFYMLTLPSELSRYHLDLYESDPANSEVIQHIIHIQNMYIYIVSAYTAVYTTVQAMNVFVNWFVYITILFGWIPIIMHFLMNQYATRKIIIKAKWQNLNRLQAQIRQLQNTDLTIAPEGMITRLKQLMDLHDRISAKPNSTLNRGTGLNLLNQLMLPLLGLFLGNIDKLLRLLTATP